MISYKVLITLTVIFIINCGGSGLTRKDFGAYNYYRVCDDPLRRAGFSGYIGYLNYCFAKQFGDIQQFENHLKEVDNTFSTEINNILKEFFEKSKSSAVDHLNDPAKFCNEHMKTKQKKCGVGCITKNVEFDEKDCVEKITMTDDGKYKTPEDELNEIVKIKKKFDVLVANIEYGNNEFKNAIKSYNLSVEKSSQIKLITGKWNEYKKMYYEYQIKNLNKKENSKLFLTTMQWCEQKKNEVRQAETMIGASNNWNTP